MSTSPLSQPRQFSFKVWVILKFICHFAHLHHQTVHGFSSSVTTAVIDSVGIRLFSLNKCHQWWCSICLFHVHSLISSLGGSLNFPLGVYARHGSACLQSSQSQRGDRELPRVREQPALHGYFKSSLEHMNRVTWGHNAAGFLGSQPLSFFFFKFLWAASIYIVQARLKLTIFLLQPFEHWN